MHRKGAVHDARRTTGGSFHARSPGFTESPVRLRERAVNNLTSFLGIAAAIFAAITVLLVLMSHLESSQADQDAEDDPHP